MPALGVPAADFGATTLIFVSENNTSTALLALRVLAAVHADFAPAALLAPIAIAAVQADAAPSALFATMAPAAVVADGVHAGW